MSDMGDFDKAVVAAMLKAKEIGVKMLASDCEEILQAAKQSMQGEAVGVVEVGYSMKHECYLDDGEDNCFSPLVDANKIPAGTKLYIHAPDSAARIAELEIRQQQLKTQLSMLVTVAEAKDERIAELEAENEALRKELDAHKKAIDYVSELYRPNKSRSWVMQILREHIDAALNIKGGAE